MSDAKQEQTTQRPEAPSDAADGHAEAPAPEGPSQDKPAPAVAKPAVEADVAKADVAKADVPKADVPKADVPKVEVPKADVPKVEVPKADVAEADLPKVDVSKGDGAKADGATADGAKGDRVGSDDSAADKLAAEAARERRRRIRRTARTEIVEAAEATTSEATTSDEEEPPPEGRRRRRRRRRARPGAQAEPAASPDGAARTDGRDREESIPDAGDPGPREQGEPERRRRRTRRRTRRQTEGSPSNGPRAAAEPAERRTPPQRAERRDATAATATATAGPEPGRAARPKRAEPAADKRAKAPGKGQDMVTLILHPQPKAAPARRRKKSGRPLTAKEALKAKAAKRGGAGSGRSKARGNGPGAEGGADTGVELQEEWLTADADQARRCVVEAGSGATQLIRAWQQQPNAAAISSIAYDSKGSEGDPIPTAIRKAARRALQVLRSRGVAVPERPAQDAPAAGGALAGDQEPEPLVATFVPPDTNGMTFFSISQRLAGGRYRVADIVIREGLGVMHASSGRLAGKQIRRWRSRVESRLGTAPVDVPLQWARYRIALAREQNATSGQVLPLGLDSCAALFEPRPDSEPSHPVAALDEDLGDAELTTATAQSDELHNDPEFRSWLPERGALDEMLRNVGTRVGAEGAQDRELVDKVMREEIEASTDRYFSPEVRGQLEQRMRDAAVSVRERADDAAARRVLCVARAVREAGLITSPPRELPFLIGFFRKGIAVMAQQGEGRLQVPVAGTPPGVDDAEPSDEGANQQVDG